ncbi:MAG: hypothetical protein NTX05_08495 [Fusobacteria bacterium]|nr:hypothetical protein [Fusobacteriota bacterium]
MKKRVLSSLAFVGFSALALAGTSGSAATSQYRDINVFLQFTPQIANQISDFNQVLTTQGMWSKYATEPLINTHSVHLTLYLTTYNTKSLPEIIKIVKEDAKSMKQFAVSTSSIQASTSNYVMLFVNNSKNPDGTNNLMQVYSDRLVGGLSPIRYLQASIPAWASSIPDKEAAYKLYGSPNVYTQFSPHFSILVANVPSANESTFISDMNGCILNDNFQPVTATAVSIGVGYADVNGQVTQILANFPLKK